MPAKRTPIARALRTPRFSDEALSLFLRLEKMRDQDCREFQDGSRHLAGLLHLGAEYLCGGAYVNDKSATHCYPDDSFPAAQDFFRVKAVREQLFAAVEAQRHHNGVRPGRVAPSHDHDAVGRTPILAAADRED
jgi:hypothetical protein